MRLTIDLKLTMVVLICSIHFQDSIAQLNAGFEKGITGWIISGKKQLVSVDSSQAFQGKYALALGPGAAISQRIHCAPLSICQFDVFVKCSDSLSRVHTAVRFYDRKNKQLSADKSATVSRSQFEQLTIYTESPPFTDYAVIEIRRDGASGEVLVDSAQCQTSIGRPKMIRESLYDAQKCMQPFWKGDTVYDELVLMVSKNGEQPQGRLLYDPSAILSIKSFDLQKQYREGADFSVQGRTVVARPGSKMNCVDDTAFDHTNNLAWYNLQSKWVQVSYVHKDKWNGPLPGYRGDYLPGTIQKLRSGSKLRIAAYGMSITRGMNVSGYDEVPPYMPSYLALMESSLKRQFSNARINMFNTALPGSTAAWGSDNADRYINPLKPDLVILDFGMNDFWSVSPEEFGAYIRSMMIKIRAANPKVEFLLLSNMDFDPEYMLESDKNKPYYVGNMQGYKNQLKGMETAGVAMVDITTLSDYIYQRKKAKDCISNPLHPNDYMARWYAQSLMAAFIKN